MRKIVKQLTRDVFVVYDGVYSTHYLKRVGDHIPGKIQFSVDNYRTVEAAAYAYFYGRVVWAGEEPT